MFSNCSSRDRLGVAAVLIRLGMFAVCGVLLLAATAEAAVFYPVGDLPGGGFESRTYGLSPDGSTAVGYSESHYDEAFSWQASTGIVPLGDFRPAATAPRGEAWDASNGGSVIVGMAWQDLIGTVPCRWTAGGIEPLGDLVGGSTSGKGMGVTGDGSVIVGYSSATLGNEAFRWTQAGGMVSLGDLDGGGHSSSATDVSADGSVVVGSGRSTLSGTNFLEAFRWTEAGGMVGLGDLPGSIFNSMAWAVSADGNVVVGQGTSTASAQYKEAFRWTAGTGMQPLGDLVGGNTYSIAYDCSGDGSIVVGSGTSALGTRAFIWDAVNGMRELSVVLTNDYGIDVSGWKLYEVRGISDNGKVIAGYGQNPSFKSEAWVVDLSAPGDAEDNPVLPDNTVPEPDGSWVFDAVPGTGCWFDPPMADGFAFETDGNSNFVSLQLPAGVPDNDGQYEIVSVHGSIILPVGSTHIFSSPVLSFTIWGIDPPVDETDPLAFPTYLTFDQQTVSFTMTPVPEPGALILLGMGAVALLRRKRGYGG